MSILQACRAPGGSRQGPGYPTAQEEHGGSQQRLPQPLVSKPPQFEEHAHPYCALTFACPGSPGPAPSYLGQLGYIDSMPLE